MINIEAKCKDCETPVKLISIIVTHARIDLSQVQTTDCPECGCKWISVRVAKEVIDVSPFLEQPSLFEA
jgi:Zn finger protein HypA/HybF involved in hydrogenase expression